MEQFDQPAPIPNDEVIVQREVISDLEDRLAHGIREYGTGLQPFNGRNSPLDAYEEELDKLVYMKTWVIERERIIAAFKEIAAASRKGTVGSIIAKGMLVKMGEWDERGSQGSPKELAD